MNAYRFIFIVLLTAICIQIWLNRCLSHEVDGLNAALTHEKNISEGYRESWENARTAQLAIETQAQACLEREARGIADAQIWQDIINQSQTRDLEEKEKKGVPDDKTRRTLLDYLDEPL